MRVVELVPPTPIKALEVALLIKLIFALEVAIELLNVNKSLLEGLVIPIPIFLVVIIVPLIFKLILLIL